MLVLSGRMREKIIFPGFHTTIQVLSIQSNTVRFGVEAPAEVRILREILPDRVAEWGPDPEEAPAAPSLLQLNQLVDRRLAIARLGLAELQQHLRRGQTEDAEVVLEKLDEDLHLLRRRLWDGVEKGAPSASRDDARCPAFS